MSLIFVGRWVILIIDTHVSSMMEPRNELASIFVKFFLTRCSQPIQEPFFSPFSGNWYVTVTDVLLSFHLCSFPGRGNA